MLSQKTCPIAQNLQTPVSNTGSECSNFQVVGKDTHLAVHVDWLQGTCHPLTDDWALELIGVVMRALNDHPVWEWDSGSFKGKQWQHRGFSVKGVRWWFDSCKDGQTAHLLLSLPGQVCSSVDVRVIRDLSIFLREVFAFKVTRLDIALDDFGKRLTFDQLMSATQKEDFAVIRSMTPIFTKRRSRGLTGWTFQLGSRSSDKCGRIYEKEMESDGESSSIRFEAEFHDEMAHSVWLEWISIEDEYFEDVSPSYLAGKVVGIAEFVDRSGSKRHIKKMKRLPWWEVFLADVGVHLRHSIKRASTSLKRAMKWVEKQVFPSLAALRKVLGIHEYRRWHDEQLAEKEANFSLEQRAKIMLWSEEKSSVGQQMSGAAEIVDEDGQKWAWVWYQSKLGSEWRVSRFYSSHGGEARVRFSGESSRTVPVGWIHLGKDKPTWQPRMIG